MIGGNAVDSSISNQYIPTPDELDHGRWLFAQDCNFLIAATEMKSLPPSDLPEIAFAGRSNVGKSSLVNALTGRKALARTSGTPGRTRELIFFNLANQLRLVDLPGYGYARAPKHAVDSWTKLIENYLYGRPNLQRVVLLLDARVGVKESDESALKLLDQAGVTTQTVITKADKVSTANLTDVIESAHLKLSLHPAAVPYCIATSSTKGVGIAELRASLGTLSKQL